MRTTIAFVSAAFVGAAVAAPALQVRQALSSVTAAVSSVVAVPSSAVGAATSAAVAPVSSAASAVVPSSAASSVAAVPSSAASSAASAAAPSASAAPNTTQGQLDAIRARNAPAFADLLAANPTVVQGIAGVVGTGMPPYTFLLPSNLDGVTANVSNPTVVDQLIHLHILPGNVTALSVPFNNSVQQTTLNNYNGTQGAQYLTFYKNRYGTTDISGSQNATIIANGTYQNIQFRLLNTALHFNRNISATLAAQPNTTALFAALNTLPQLAQQVDTASAITVFAPVNSALTAATQLLATANSTTLQQVIQNHVISGQTVTSQAIAGGQTVTNANGGTITFATNATGTYVTSGGATARLGKTDILGTAGVIHQIEGLLFAPPAAAAIPASSAASAASSVASATASATSAAASVSGLIASAATSAPATAAA